MNRIELENASKCLFMASENVRECLDTIDLKELPIDLSTVEALESLSSYLEKTAQRFQKLARS